MGMPVGSIGPTRARVLAGLRVSLERAGFDFGRRGGDQAVGLIPETERQPGWSAVAGGRSASRAASPVRDRMPSLR